MNALVVLIMDVLAEQPPERVFVQDDPVIDFEPHVQQPQSNRRNDEEVHPRDRIGAGWCPIGWGRTCVNLGIRWVDHPWIDVKGEVEKLSNINADKY